MRNASGPHSSTLHCQSHCSTIGSESSPLAEAGLNKAAIREKDWTIRAYGERSGEVLERLRKIIIISTEPEARSAERMIRTSAAAMNERRCIGIVLSFLTRLRHHTSSSAGRPRHRS
jgi:hypothetical protein